MDKMYVAPVLALCMTLLALHSGESAILAARLPTTVDSLDRTARSVPPSDSSNAATAPDESGQGKECHSTTPCGWAVYTPFSRRVEYFMKNTCECPKDRECLRTDEDLSVSAYVYRCRTADSKPMES